MHITLLAASLAINAPAELTAIPGLVTQAFLSGRTAVRQTHTVTSAGKAGARVGTECSGDGGVTWLTLTQPVVVDALGAKATPRVNGRVDWEPIPIACQGDALIRAISIGGGTGSTNLTLTNIAAEVQ